MSSNLKQRARECAGACLHRAGLYQRLLPVHCPAPGWLAHRLQSYLLHYYRSVGSADADLYLPDLDVRLACDLKDHMLWHYLEGLVPVYELAEIRYCQQYVREGDCILDVGANHGFWGFPLARRAGARSRLYLCEANPAVLARLRRSVGLNPDVLAHVLPVAIGDGTQERLDFYLPSGNLSGLGSTVLHDYASSKGWLQADRRISVECRSVDQLVAAGELDGIDVMKIDVEQAEDAVVRGALGALARFRPRLVMVETGAGSQACAMLRDLGYSSHTLGVDGRPQAVPAGFWGNIFFCPEAAR